jgi:citronellol/citronellal dehydrogenase
MSTLQGKTLFITGASRGIGKAIALRAAREGANVAVVGKTNDPHPKLEGTVHSAAEEIEAAGGRALACVADVRFEDQMSEAVARTVSTFGGIDVLVNNASAISLTATLATDMKRYDLMHQINTRGTFLCSKLCIPHLLRSENPHILTLSPPPKLEPAWFSSHLAYTIAKYGMSLCVLGLAEEYKGQIGVNALWPRTVIATAAVQNLLGGPEMMKHSRKPEIVADAAHRIVTRPARAFSGNFCIDEDVLRAAGVTDFDQYQVDPSAQPFPDLFV